MFEKGDLIRSEVVVVPPKERMEYFDSNVLNVMLTMEQFVGLNYRDHVNAARRYRASFTLFEDSWKDETYVALLNPTGARHMP